MFLHVERDVHVPQSSHHLHQLRPRERKMAARQCLSVELCVVEGGQVEGEERGEGAESLHESRRLSGRELAAPGQELESRD